MFQYTFVYCLKNTYIFLSFIYYSEIHIKNIYILPLYT